MPSRWWNNIGTGWSPRTANCVVNQRKLVFTVKDNSLLYSTMLNNVACFGQYDHSENTLNTCRKLRNLVNFTIIVNIWILGYLVIAKFTKSRKFLDIFNAFNLFFLQFFNYRNIWMLGYGNYDNLANSDIYTYFTCFLNHVHLCLNMVAYAETYSTTEHCWIQKKVFDGKYKLPLIYCK
jgi:hypothetical protein